MSRTATAAVLVAVLSSGAAPASAAPPAPAPEQLQSFSLPLCGGVVQVVELVNRERSRERDGVTTTRGRYVLQVGLVEGKTVTLNVSGPTSYDASGTFTGTGNNVLSATDPATRAPSSPRATTATCW